ncbi:BlaI/MecI/CopY family transcriptional regulator [Olivibacter sitiensis]|uniref:BlaI/MecI/CopY family transcriptional regulator n=1 Tax=Olivibacter sitiensis TaxID=376470 RepID=UPI00041184B2|nr:BlaI/MecI/CopY family transcriptional regulator [Olivibacter sitiensis]
MKKLTAQEEQAMQAIWKSKGGFISELKAEMDADEIPYTTLASTIKNLQRKGYIKGVKYANAYRYEPLIEEEEYKKTFMSGFVNNYFKNSYKELVSFFAKEEKLSTDDLKDIIHMIENEKDH